MIESDYWAQVDVPRRAWDPTEGHHSRHGERPFADIYGLEVHWIGPGEVGDHGDTGTELLAFERFHEVSKGWYDLFYNVAVDTEGVSYEGRDATIPSQSDLRRWLTLLVVLGSGDHPKVSELDAIGRRIWGWWGAVDPDRHPEALRCHRDRAQTACPGATIAGVVSSLRTGRLSYHDETGEDDPAMFKYDPESGRQFLHLGGTVYREYGTVRTDAAGEALGEDVPGLAFVLVEQAGRGNVTLEG